jgi:hypothetical protein
VARPDLPGVRGGVNHEVFDIVPTEGSDRRAY